MKAILFFLTSLSVTAWADCPYEITTHQQTYCVELNWESGSKKVQGEFQLINEASPLLSSQMVPQKWLYSNLSLKIWEKEDSEEKAVAIKDLSLFPYMMMTMGHNHSTTFDFSWEPDNLVYQLSEVRFQEMKGCWSLRWSTDSTMDLSDSQSVLEKSKKLMDLVEYTNISQNKIEALTLLCESISGEPSHGDHHNGHH